MPKTIITPVVAAATTQVSMNCALYSVELTAAHLIRGIRKQTCRQTAERQTDDASCQCVEGVQALQRGRHLKAE